MTKYEWERELRKNIKSLPPDEIDKIIDFYDELFEDKAESGMRESEIITEFGNPFDVARRIVNDYEYVDGRNGGGHRKSDDDDFVDDRPEFLKKWTGDMGKSFTKFTDSVHRAFGKKDDVKHDNDDDDDRNPRCDRDDDDDRNRRSDRDSDDDDDDDDDRNRRRRGKKADKDGDSRRDRNNRKNVRDERRDGAERGGRGRDRRADSDYDDHRYIDGGRYERVRYENSDRDDYDDYDRVRSARYGDDNQGKKKGFWSKFFKVLLLAIPVFVITVTLVSLVVSLFASGIACIGGGAAQTVIGFMSLPVSKAVALSKVGMGAVVFSAGMLLTIFSVWLGKLTTRIFKAMFGRKNKDTVRR